VLPEKRQRFQRHSEKIFGMAVRTLANLDKTCVPFGLDQLVAYS